MSLHYSEVMAEHKESTAEDHTLQELQTEIKQRWSSDKNKLKSVLMPYYHGRDSLVTEDGNHISWGNRCVIPYRMKYWREFILAVC